MKNNKFTKILIYSVCSLVLAGIIFLAISYFGKEEQVQKNDTSQNSKKQEQVDKPKDKEDTKENKIEESNDQTVKHQEEQKTENKKTYHITLSFPKDDLSKATVEAVAKKIVDTKVLNNDKHTLTGFKKATYTTREVSELQ